jgi:hypothetical protein
VMNQTLLMINLLLVWTATRKWEGYPDCFEFVV